MSASVRVFQVDAFTSQRFCGNPAGVVLAADELSEAQMRALARELNNGDSAFLLRPDAPDHDLRVRFFTPRSEAAFVGHATLAAHAVLAHLGHEIGIGAEAAVLGHGALRIHVQVQHGREIQIASDGAKLHRHGPRQLSHVMEIAQAAKFRG